MRSPDGTRHPRQRGNQFIQSMFYSEDCLIRLIYRIYYTISRLKVF
jgi:hypothetical protein